MSFATRETSRNSGQPFELYQFLTDLQAWRFTSGDQPRSYGGHTYLPEAIVRTNTSQSTENKGGHIKVTLPQSTDLAALFVNFIPSLPLYLTVFRNHDGEAESEMKVGFTGRVLSAQFTTNDTCELDCAPESELLKRRIASQTFQKPCNRILYDQGCTVDRESKRTDAVLSSVSADGLTIQSAAFATQPDGWFAMGYIELDGARRMVISHVGNTLVLMNAMNGLAAGAAISAFAGCDRLYATCETKFANGVNFFGFEWIPVTNPYSSGVA